MKAEELAEQILAVFKTHVENNGYWVEKFHYRGITLTKTCDAFPEQYDAHDESGSQVGYIRNRHGSFEVSCPGCWPCEVVLSEDAAPIGCFEDDKRDDCLRRAVDAIIKWMERDEGE